MNYRVESRSMVLLVLVWIVGVDSVGHVSRDQERVSGLTGGLSQNKIHYICTAIQSLETGLSSYCASPLVQVDDKQDFLAFSKELANTGIKRRNFVKEFPDI